MTYPVMPKYLTPEDFQQLASETGVPPVDNHASFDALRASGTFEEYVFPQDHPAAAERDPRREFGAVRRSRFHCRRRGDSRRAPRQPRFARAKITSPATPPPSRSDVLGSGTGMRL